MYVCIFYFLRLKVKNKNIHICLILKDFVLTFYFMTVISASFNDCFNSFSRQYLIIHFGIDDLSWAVPLHCSIKRKSGDSLMSAVFLDLLNTLHIPLSAFLLPFLLFMFFFTFWLDFFFFFFSIPMLYCFF